MDLDQNILRSDEQTIFRLRGLYENYGYRRFKMSKFEAYDLYVRNKDFLVSDRMITFTDARGVLMALKPDVTLSIIKNTRENEPGPRKVYYNETVYRSGKGDEGFQEIMQTGLECIGELDLYHIYEVTALAVRSLAAISPDYVLDVSHVGLVSGFMEAAGVAEEDYPEVMAAVRSKNLAALDSCLAAAEQALGDYRRFAELDVRFHSLLSRATGNQVAMIVTDVLGQVEQHTLLKKMETLNDSACLALERRILARHREILSAIHRQDDAAAKQAMREHTRAAATDLKV